MWYSDHQGRFTGGLLVVSCSFSLIKGLVVVEVVEIIRGFIVVVVLVVVVIVLIVEIVDEGRYCGVVINSVVGL